LAFAGDVFVIELNITHSLRSNQIMDDVLPNSFRLVEYTDDGQLIIQNASIADNDRYCVQIEYTAAFWYGRSDCGVWQFIWALPPISLNSSRYYYLYFDTVTNGWKPSFLPPQDDDLTVITGDSNGDGEIDNFIMENPFLRLGRGRDPITKLLSGYRRPKFDNITIKESGIQLVQGYRIHVSLTNSSLDRGVAFKEDDYPCQIQVWRQNRSVWANITVRGEIFGKNVTLFQVWQLVTGAKSVFLHVWVTTPDELSYGTSYCTRGAYFSIDHLDRVVSQNFQASLGDFMLVDSKYIIAYNSTHTTEALGLLTWKNTTLRVRSFGYACDIYSHSLQNNCFRYIMHLGTLVNQLSLFDIIINGTELAALQYHAILKRPSIGHSLAIRDPIRIVVETLLTPSAVLACLSFGGMLKFNLSLVSDATGQIWQNSQNIICNFDVTDIGLWNFSIILFTNQGVVLLNRTVLVKEFIHPNLLFQAADLLLLREKAKTSHLTFWHGIYSTAEEYLHETPPSIWTPDYEFEIFHRILMHLSFTYVISGEEKFAAKAHLWAQTLINYPNITFNGPDDDRRRAHLVIGLCFYYDWLYHELDVELRQTIRDWIVIEAEIMYEILLNQQYWWTFRLTNNHNWVFAAGLGVAGFTLSGEIDRAELWINQVLQNFHDVEQILLSDGATREGLGYWEYGLQYLLLFTDLYKIRRNISLYSHPFFSNTSLFRLYLTMPNRREVCYISDCGRTGIWEGTGKWGSPLTVSLKLANEFNDGYAQWAGLATGPNVGQIDLWAPSYASMAFQASDFVAAGEYSACIKDLSSSQRTALLSPCVGSEGANSVQFSALVRLQKPGTITIRLSEFNSQIPIQIQNYIQAIGAGRWVRVETTFFFHSQTSKFQVSLSPTWDLPATNTAWFDVVELCLDSLGSNVMPNSGFEISSRADPLAFLWYNSEILPQAPTNLPLCRIFPDLGVLSSRTGWGLDDSLFLIKAGPVNGGHEHPDQGSMIFFSRGKHVLIDDEYTNNFWKVTHRHNTFVIDGIGQIREYIEWPEMGEGEILWYEMTNGMTSFVLEAQNAYPDEAELILFQREGVFVNAWHDGLVLLSDYVILNESKWVNWYFHTDAAIIDTGSPRSFILDLDGTLFSCIVVSHPTCLVTPAPRYLGLWGTSNEQRGSFFNISSFGDVFQMHTVFMPLGSDSAEQVPVRFGAEFVQSPLEYEFSISQLKVYCLFQSHSSLVSLPSLGGMVQNLVLVNDGDTTFISGSRCESLTIGGNPLFRANSPVSIVGEITPYQISFTIDVPCNIQFDVPLQWPALRIKNKLEPCSTMMLESSGSPLQVNLTKGLYQLTIRLASFILPLEGFLAPLFLMVLIVLRRFWTFTQLKFIVGKY
jgi:hypothetical protein